jgi:hypothetical protein
MDVMGNQLVATRKQTKRFSCNAVAPGRALSTNGIKSGVIAKSSIDFLRANFCDFINF